MAKHSKFQIILEYALARSILASLGLLPRLVAVVLGVTMGRVAYLLPGTLREGGTLGILSDLNTQPYEGVFVPFFGKLACTTAGIATLALKTDAVVIPTCAVWNRKKKRYFFHGDPPVELVRTGDHAKDIEVNTANFAAAMERMIRLYPDQWLWIHKRWKTRPAGEAEIY